MFAYNAFRLLESIASFRDRDTSDRHLAIKGIDVSKWQGAIDWPAVGRALGPFGFAYVKATEGQDFQDPRFARNAATAHACGLYVGAYHFARLDSIGSTPEDDARAEVQDFYRSAREVWPSLSLPPALDIELGGIKGQDPGKCRRWISAAVDETIACFGRSPVIYTGYWTWRYLGRPGDYNGLPLWLANYTNRTTPSASLGRWPPAIWQYTGKGSIAGVAGAVDRNRWMGTPGDFLQFVGEAP